MATTGLLITSLTNIFVLSPMSAIAINHANEALAH
jgi:FtsH-binding integral membrane protein